MSFGGAVKLQGEGAYRKALKGITGDLKLLASEMKLVTAQYGKNDKSVEGLRASQDVLNRQIEKQTEKVSTLRGRLEDAAAEYGKDSDKVKKYQTELNNAEAKLAGLNRKLEENKSDLAAAEKASESENTALGKLTAKIEAEEKELKALKEAHKNAQLEGKGSEKQTKELEGKIIKLSSALNENKKRLKEATDATDKLGTSQEDAGDKAEDAAEGGFTTFKATLANLTATVITSAINKLKQLATATVEAGANFEASMSQVEAISGATGKDLESLTAKAQEMGAKTKYSASESADAFNYMAMAGWKTEDMINGIEGVMNLAAASGEDLATTSDIVTDALTAMGYSAGDAGKLADVMAAASANANTNVGLMGSTFQYAAPIVGSLGYTMEDTAVAIGLMANSGIKGTKAGTALRSIMTRLSTDAGASSKKLGALGTLTEKLGVAFYDASGKTRPLNKVLAEAREKWKGLSAEQQTSYGKTIAGTNALSGWLSLMNAAPADINKLTKAVKTSNGAASKMADTMQNNVKGTLTKLKSQIEGVQIQIFKKLAPAFQSALKEASKFVKGINWNNVGNAIKGGLGKAVDALKFLIKNAGLVTTGLKVMIAAFAVKKVWEFTKGISDGAKALIAYIKQIGLTTAAKIADTTAEGANTVAKGAATVATGALTAAQTALNTAMKSNPIGLVASALAALVVVVGSAVASSNQLTEAEKKEQEQLEKTAERIKSTKEEWQSLESERQKNVDKGMTEISHYEALRDELDKIVDKNGKVKKGYEERAEFITSTLNEALGTEFKMTGNIVENYDKQIKKIDEIIEKQKAKIILDSQEAEYKKAVEEIDEATRNLIKTKKAYIEERTKHNELETKYTEAETALAKAAAEYSKDYKDSEARAAWQAAQTKYDAVKSEYDKETEIYNKKKSNYQSDSDTFKKYSYTLQQYENNYAKFKAGKYDEMSKATWKYVKNYQGAGDAEKKMLEDNIKTTSKKLAEWRKIKKENNTKAYDDLIKAAEKERKGYQDQLSSYISSSEKHVKGASVTWSKALETQLSTITGKKVKFKDAGKGNVQMMIDGVAVGEPKSKKQMSSLVTKMIGQITGKKGKAAEAGRNLINGLNDGITDDKILSKTYKNIENFGKNLLKHLKDSLEEKSPSKATQEMGEFLVKGITVGTKKEERAAKESLRKLGKQLIESLKANPTHAKDLGSSFIKRFNSSVTSSINQAKSKLKKTINAFVNSQSKDVQSAYKSFGEKALTQFGKQLENASAGVTKKLQSKITTLTTQMQTKLEEVNTKISAMQSKLSNYGNLFTTITSDSGYEAVFLTDINSQIADLKQYQRNLNSLKGKVSSALMARITDMSVEDALKYTNELLKLSKGNLAAYNNAFVKKERLSKSISKKFYADEVADIKKNYTNKIKKALNDAKKQIKEIGKQTMKGFIKGMKSTKFSKDLKGIANDIVKAMKKALGIKSPSTVFRDQVGKNLALGLGLGFDKTMKNVAQKMTEAVPTEFEGSYIAGKGLGNRGSAALRAATSLTTNFNFDNVNIASDLDIKDVAHKVSDIFISDLAAKGGAFA